VTPERYQRINAVADGALELPPDKRAAFLEAQCSGDPELRAQVEELLGAHTAQNPLLDTPLLDRLAQDMVAAPHSADLAGKQFLHYQVLSRLGAGGVGEVWLARDTRLARQAALKLLSPLFAADPRHIRRFQQEARAASTLNHPNIVTIYETGKVNNVDFIAQEFVEGQTLRQMLAGGALPIITVLEIGAQVAAALAAAHGAGLAHRDIKPENLMLRSDGLVKVLDFGLARFVEEEPAEARMRRVSVTRPGFVMGTVKYMSPEQARGKAVDARSDIFSLGVVLYELLAGAPPFTGPTPGDVMAAILAQEAAPITTVRPETPAALEALLAECLQKGRDARFDSAQRLRLELLRVLRRLQSPDELTPGSDELLVARDNLTRQLARPHERRRRRAPLLIAAGAFLAAFIVVIFAWAALRQDNDRASFSSMNMTRVITQGLVSDAAISPDAAAIAYVLNQPDAQSIWTRQIATGREQRIIGPEPGDHADLAFTPDGAWLVYRRTVDAGTFSLFKVPLHGGAPVLLQRDLANMAAFSPDSRHYAYVQLDPERDETRVIVANADGSGQHIIARRRRPRFYSRYGLAWSPDGKYIACMAGEAAGYSDHPFHLLKIRVSDGSERNIGSHHWLWVETVAWPARDGAVFVSGAENLDDTFQIWSVSASTGATARVTNDVANYSQLSMPSNGRAILALQTVRSFELWVAPHGDANRAVEVTSGNVRSFNSLAWTPDGRIIYSALAGDARNLWMIDASGANLRQLTSGSPNKTEPAVTPDGRYILYHYYGHIWRVNIDGSNPKQLTDGADDVHPEPSGDSKWVYYASFREWCPGIGGKPTLWQIPIDGGEPIPLSDIPASVPRVSPDGRLIACEYFPRVDPQLSPDYVAILNSLGGRPIKVLDNVPASRSFVSWAPNGRAVEFTMSTGRIANIWRESLNGGRPEQVTHFRDGLIAGYAWSRDGSQLAVARGNVTRDIVLMNAAGNQPPGSKSHRE